MKKILLSIVALIVLSSAVFAVDFDAGPAMTEKEAKEKVDQFEQKCFEFMEKHNIKDLRSLFFLKVNAMTDIRVVLDALGEPEEETFHKTPRGTSVNMFWTSSNGRSLEINGYTKKAGDYPKILSATYHASNGIDEEDINRIRRNKKLLAEAQDLYLEHIWAERCLEAIQKKRWIYEKKEFDADLAGWAGTKARFRLPKNSLLVLRDPRNFSRDDQILLRGYLYSHVGIENDSMKIHEVKIWTAEEKEKRQGGTQASLGE